MNTSRECSICKNVVRIGRFIMNITEKKEENKITLIVEGRVDTNTSPQLQDSILKSFVKSNDLVLDFGQCAYMSSAGLRALLIGQKTANSKKGSMVLINVPAVLMDVLEMTGFADILTIQ